MVFQCPRCASVVKAADGAAGDKVACASCGADLIVPGRGEMAEVYQPKTESRGFEDEAAAGPSWRAPTPVASPPSMSGSRKRDQAPPAPMAAMPSMSDFRTVFAGSPGCLDTDKRAKDIEASFGRPGARPLAFYTGSAGSVLFTGRGCHYVLGGGTRGEFVYADVRSVGSGLAARLADGNAVSLPAPPHGVDATGLGRLLTALRSPETHAAWRRDAAVVSRGRRKAEATGCLAFAFALVAYVIYFGAGGKRQFLFTRWGAFLWFQLLSLPVAGVIVWLWYRLKGEPASAGSATAVAAPSVSGMADARARPRQNVRNIVLGLIGVVAGAGILVRNLSGGTLAGQQGSPVIAAIGALFGLLMMGAGAWPLVGALVKTRRRSLGGGPSRAGRGAPDPQETVGAALQHRTRRRPGAALVAPLAVVAVAGIAYALWPRLPRVTSSFWSLCPEQVDSVTHANLARLGESAALVALARAWRPVELPPELGEPVSLTECRCEGGRILLAVFDRQLPQGFSGERSPVQFGGEIAFRAAPRQLAVTSPGLAEEAIERLRLGGGAQPAELQESLSALDGVYDMWSCRRLGPAEVDRVSRLNTGFNTLENVSGDAVAVFVGFGERDGKPLCRFGLQMGSRGIVEAMYLTYTFKSHLMPVVGFDMDLLRPRFLENPGNRVGERGQLIWLASPLESAELEANALDFFEENLR